MHALLCSCLIALALATPRVQHLTGVISNQYVLWDDATLDGLIVDVGYSKQDLVAVQQFTSANNIRVHAAYLTHPHPDHCGASKYAASLFPGMDIYMVSEAVIQNLQQFSSMYFNDTYDYEALLLPLPGDISSVLYLETETHNITFRLVSDFFGTEAHFESFLASSELAAMFPGDLAYGFSQHMWLGPGVGPQGLQAWKGDLNWIAMFSANEPPQNGWTLYPGHGEPTNDIQQLLYANQQYLWFFTEYLCIRQGNLTHVVEDIRAKFPNYGGVALGFLPSNSAVWLAASKVLPGPCYYQLLD